MGTSGKCGLTDRKRQVVVDIVVELEPAVLPELKNRDGSYGLGHRRQHKQSVIGNGYRGVYLSQAVVRAPNHPAVLDDQRSEPGVAASNHGLRDERVQVRVCGLRNRRPGDQNEGHCRERRHGAQHSNVSSQCSFVLGFVSLDLEPRRKTPQPTPRLACRNSRLSGITSFPAACRLVARIPLLSRAGPAYNQDIIPGAQSEREGDAGPVRRCLAAEASPAALLVQGLAGPGMSGKACISLP